MLSACSSTISGHNLVTFSSTDFPFWRSWIAVSETGFVIQLFGAGFGPPFEPPGPPFGLPEPPASWSEYEGANPQLAPSTTGNYLGVKYGREPTIRPEC